jgi:hypothetical protein
VHASFLFRWLTVFLLCQKARKAASGNMQLFVLSRHASVHLAYCAPARYLLLVNTRKHVWRLNTFCVRVLSGLHAGAARRRPASLGQPRPRAGGVEIVGGALGVGGSDLDDAMHLHGIRVAPPLREWNTACSGSASRNRARSCQIDAFNKMTRVLPPLPNTVIWPAASPAGVVHVG